jgi:hypothetical protein
MLKYEFQNRHCCNCKNKKKLKIAEESSYYIWNMKFFTDPVTVREGSPYQEAMVVREHKPIFVAACNTAYPADRFHSTVRTVWMNSSSWCCRIKSSRRQPSLPTTLEDMIANL